METESKSMHQARSKQPALTRHTHTALTVPELLVTIFSWLSKADLTRVARICRFWTPFALDKIWETIPDLQYLMKLYSIIAQKAGELQDISGGDRWDIFWAYCCRVRAVETEFGPAVNTPGVIDDLRSQVENHLCGSSLLPNLRSIVVSVRPDQPHLTEVLPIIPAGLCGMKFLHGTSSTAAQRFLNHLSTIPLSHLSDVYFLCANRDRLAPSTLATFLQANRATLVDLSLHKFPLTVSGLKQLGSFPGVTNLKVGQEGAATELHEFFGMIAFSFPNLRFINVTLDEAITEDVSVSVIESLAACRGLRTVYLRTRRWGSVTAEDVGRFGSWWPSMQIFWLFQLHPYPDQVRTPLGILQDFARVWSRTLHGLWLEFEVEAPLPSLSSVKFKFEGMSVLDVGHADIPESSVDGVVAFLRKVSPGRLKIRTLGRSSRTRWDAVMDKVNAQFVIHEDVVLP